VDINRTKLDLSHYGPDTLTAMLGLADPGHLDLSNGSYDGAALPCKPAHELAGLNGNGDEEDLAGKSRGRHVEDLKYIPSKYQLPVGPPYYQRSLPAPPAEPNKYYCDSLLLYQHAQGAEHLLTVASMMEGLAECWVDRARYKDAEGLLQQALDIRVRLQGPDHTATIDTKLTLAVTFFNQSKHEEAEVLIRDVVDWRKRVLGTQHEDTIDAMIHLGNVMQSQGKLSEAELWYSQALQVCGEVVVLLHLSVAMYRTA
jgi:tetratricopeptide (TPR) repeat protein